MFWAGTTNQNGMASLESLITAPFVASILIFRCECYNNGEKLAILDFPNEDRINEYQWETQ